MEHYLQKSNRTLSSKKQFGKFFIRVSQKAKKAKKSIFIHTNGFLFIFKSIFYRKKQRVKIRSFAEKRRKKTVKKNTEQKNNQKMRQYFSIIFHILHKISFLLKNPHLNTKILKTRFFFK